MVVARYPPPIDARNLGAFHSRDIDATVKIFGIFFIQITPAPTGAEFPLYPVLEKPSSTIVPGFAIPPLDIVVWWCIPFRAMRAVMR